MFLKLFIKTQKYFGMKYLHKNKITKSIYQLPNLKIEL